ncbi:hypothetical protein CDAR_18801 [Caerostris darwini]|uniref:Uncharacterized protein n=1 Tax=Caerostris darwini TaxID=1538125 RepID=A0AAV4WEA4_9ARAC|nr:hypothetical protein CDAR_18801 [Caerostris darwini]
MCFIPSPPPPLKGYTRFHQNTKGEKYDTEFFKLNSTLSYRRDTATQINSPFKNQSTCQANHPPPSLILQNHPKKSQNHTCIRIHPLSPIRILFSKDSLNAQKILQPGPAFFDVFLSTSNSNLLSTYFVFNYKVLTL